MNLAGEQILLRVYLANADRAPRTPTWELLVKSARNAGMAGCTVIQGIMGLGLHGLLSPSAWSVVEQVPVIVEIVDTRREIGEFLNGPAAGVLKHCTVTLERAHVMMYRATAGSLKLAMGQPQPPLANLPVIQPRDNMTINEDGVLLRVFLGESDRHQHQKLHEAIVHKARELGLAGATVIRGIEGFGASSVVHKAKLLEMSTDLPVVVEIVDEKGKIELLLPHLEQMMKEGLITMEHVAILRYRYRP